MDLNPIEKIMGRIGQTIKYSQKDLWNKKERNYHAKNKKTDRKINYCNNN